MKTKFIPLFILLLTAMVSCKFEKENEKSGDQTTEATNTTGTTGAGFKITFNAVVDKDDAFQLFYNEDGTEGYTGDQMSEVKITGKSEAQDISFLLPDDARPLNLRFDIGSNKELKEVKFNNFKMEYKGKVFSTDGTKFFKYFYPNEQVVCDTVKSVAKNIGKEGQPFDPIIGGTLHLRNELEKFYKK